MTSRFWAWWYKRKSLRIIKRYQPKQYKQIKKAWP